MPDVFDPYKVLQVDSEAENEVIQAAYRRLARKYHPDLAATPEAAARMSAINAAWELIGDPDREGVQLIARADNRDAIGFATVYWSWNTLIATRVGIMHDLFVVPSARGTGAADLLISACVDECRKHGATTLAWQTARDNTRAQRVYERVGATREEWVDYWLNVNPEAS